MLRKYVLAIATTTSVLVIVALLYSQLEAEDAKVLAPARTNDIRKTEFLLPEKEKGDREGIQTKIDSEKTIERVKGRVVDEGGNPIEGVLIQTKHFLQDTVVNETTNTDSNGRFLIEGPFVLRFKSGNETRALWGDGPTFIFSMAGKERLLRGLTHYSDDKNPDEVNVVLRQAVHVRGRVVDDRTGKGVPGVTVRLSSANDRNLPYDRTTKTDSDGCYQTSFGVMKGEYVIFVFDETNPQNEIVGKTEVISVTLGNPVFFAPDLRVSQCGWIEVSFVDEKTEEPVVLHRVQVNHVLMEGKEHASDYCIDQLSRLLTSGKSFKIRAYPGNNILRLGIPTDIEDEQGEIKGLEAGGLTKPLKVESDKTTSLTLKASLFR